MDAARRLRACALAFALATAASLAASPAHAASAEIPSECGSRAAFERELTRRLGETPELEQVHLSITRAPSSYHLRVQLGSEQRELDDPSCSELFNASIVIAMSLLLHGKPPPPEPAPEPPPAQTPADAVKAHPDFALGAGVGVSFGTLPPPVLALDLEGKLLWQRWGVALGLRYLAPGETPSSQSRGVKLHALGGGLSGVFRPAPSWEARVGVGAQRLSGEGVGAAAVQSGAAWAAGPTLGASWTPLDLSPFWAGLSADGQLNLLRAKFEILNYSGDVYEVSWLSGSAFVRLGLIW